MLFLFGIFGGSYLLRQSQNVHRCMMHVYVLCTKMCTKGILWHRDFNEISANSYQISSTHSGQNHICLTISDLTLSFLFSGWKENIQYLNHYLQGNSLSTDVCSVGKTFACWETFGKTSALQRSRWDSPVSTCSYCFTKSFSTLSLYILDVYKQTTARHELFILFWVGKCGPRLEKIVQIFLTKYIEDICWYFLSDPSPIIGYACH